MIFGFTLNNELAVSSLWDRTTFISDNIIFILFIAFYIPGLELKHPYNSMSFR